MTARIRFRDDAGGLRTAARVGIRDADNVLRTVQRIRIRNISNVLKTVYQTLSAAVSPSSVSAYGSTGAIANLTTSATTASPVGGVSPFTYAWAQKTASPYTWVINAAAAATTDFTCNALPPGSATSANFEVTVTDALGATATATVTANANNGLPYDPYAGKDIDLASRN